MDARAASQTCSCQLFVPVKVFALGIEEQLVRTVVDFVDSPEKRRNPGPDYRVVVHVVTWSGSQFLTVPIGALFRVVDRWAVFRVEGRGPRDQGSGQSSQQPAGRSAVRACRRRRGRVASG